MSNIILTIRRRRGLSVQSHSFFDILLLRRIGFDPRIRQFCVIRYCLCSVGTRNFSESISYIFRPHVGSGVPTKFGRKQIFITSDRQFLII